MSERETIDAIMAWICAQETTRVIGMRDGLQGEKLVCYVDTMGGPYVSQWGCPVQPLQHDPAIVLVASDTWAHVLEELRARAA